MSIIDNRHTDFDQQLPDGIRQVFVDFIRVMSDNFSVLGQQSADLKNENSKLRNDLSKISQHFSASHSSNPETVTR